GAGPVPRAQPWRRLARRLVEGPGLRLGVGEAGHLGLDSSLLQRRQHAELLVRGEQQEHQVGAAAADTVDGLAEVAARLDRHVAHAARPEVTLAQAALDALELPARLFVASAHE